MSININRNTLLACALTACAVFSFGAMKRTATADAGNASQKWEYKWVVIYRTYAPTKDGDPIGTHRAQAWDNWIEDTKFLPQPVNLWDKLKEVGDAGWELVSVAPRSGMAGEGHTSGGTRTGTDVEGYTRDIAGFTSEEIWVFKRPKN